MDKKSKQVYSALLIAIYGDGISLREIHDLTGLPISSISDLRRDFRENSERIRTLFRKADLFNKEARGAFLGHLSVKVSDTSLNFGHHFGEDSRVNKRESGGSSDTISESLLFNINSSNKVKSKKGSGKTERSDLLKLPYRMRDLTRASDKERPLWEILAYFDRVHFDKYGTELGGNWAKINKLLRSALSRGFKIRDLTDAIDTYHRTDGQYELGHTLNNFVGAIDRYVALSKKRSGKTRRPITNFKKIEDARKEELEKFNNGGSG